MTSFNNDPANPLWDADQKIEDEHDRIIREEQENRLREATAIQVYPMFLAMFTHVSKSPITGQLQGANIDVVHAATMAWQAAEALAGVGKASNKGRAFTPDHTKQPESKGIIQ